MAKLNAPFRYDYVGSFLRPERLKQARKDFENNIITKKELEKNQEKLQEMLEEYRSIEKCLEEEFLYQDREKEYRDMVELIIRIADYILRDSQEVRKGFGKVMGGKVLELESDKLIKKGIELEKENTEKERRRADAAEAEVKRLKLLLQEKQ